MFHLFLIVHFRWIDGEHTFKFEKNHIVEIYESNDLGTEHLDVPLNGRNPDVKGFIANAEKYQGDKFWNYNPLNNNCQVFVTSLLKGNGFGNEEIYKFVMQDAEKVLTGYTSRFAQGVTDIASRADILLTGNAFAYRPF